MVQFYTHAIGGKKFAKWRLDCKLLVLAMVTKFEENYEDRKSTHLDAMSVGDFAAANVHIGEQTNLQKT